MSDLSASFFFAFASSQFVAFCVRYFIDGPLDRFGGFNGHVVGGFALPTPQLRVSLRSTSQPPTIVNNPLRPNPQRIARCRHDPRQNAARWLYLCPWVHRRFDCRRCVHLHCCSALQLVSPPGRSSSTYRKDGSCFGSIPLLSKIAAPGTRTTGGGACRPSAGIPSDCRRWPPRYNAYARRRPHTPAHHRGIQPAPMRCYPAGEPGSMPSTHRHRV